MPASTITESAATICQAPLNGTAYPHIWSSRGLSADLLSIPKIAELNSVMHELTLLHPGEMPAGRDAYNDHTAIAVTMATGEDWRSAFGESVRAAGKRAGFDHQATLQRLLLSSTSGARDDAFVRYFDNVTAQVVDRIRAAVDA